MGKILEYLTQDEYDAWQEQERQKSQEKAAAEVARQQQAAQQAEMERQQREAEQSYREQQAEVERQQREAMAQQEEQARREADQQRQAEAAYQASMSAAPDYNQAPEYRQPEPPPEPQQPGPNAWQRAFSTAGQGNDWARQNVPGYAGAADVAGTAVGLAGQGFEELNTRTAQSAMMLGDANPASPRHELWANRTRSDADAGAYNEAVRQEAERSGLTGFIPEGPARGWAGAFGEATNKALIGGGPFAQLQDVSRLEQLRRNYPEAFKETMQARDEQQKQDFERWSHEAKNPVVEALNPAGLLTGGQLGVLARGGLKTGITTREALTALRTGDALPAAGRVARQLATEQRGGANLGEVLGKTETPTKRYYHGTGSDFPTPEPGKFDPNGLYGPGYYLTSDPEVAASYAKGSLGKAASQDASITQATDVINQLQQQINRTVDPSRVIQLQDRIANQKSYIDYLRSQRPNAGPNIRPIDVPEGLKLLDAEAPIGTDRLQAVRGALEQRYGADSANVYAFDSYISEIPPKIGHDLFQVTQHAAGFNTPKAAVREQAPTVTTQLLQSAGYDGIRYQGGKRIPLKDAAGNPVQHEVVVIFPESLPKLTNALSKTQGGAAQIGPALDIGAGAIGAGSQYDPNATPEENAARMAAGGLVGAGLAHGLRKGVMGLGVEDVSKGKQGGMFQPGEVPPQFPTKGIPGGEVKAKDLFTHPMLPDNATQMDKARLARDEQLRAGQQDMFGGTPAPESPLIPPTTPEQQAERAAQAARAAQRQNATFPVDQISVDAERFQFKIGTGPTGTSGTLADVKEWDPAAGQGMMLWYDPVDGKNYVVNGHNRLAKAKELGVQQVDNPYWIQATTDSEARAKGALANIAEGHGTAMDTARFFRDSRMTIEEAKAKLPVRQKIVTDGLALSRLNDGLFARVYRGDMPEEWGVIIGSKIDDHTLQSKTVQILEHEANKGRNITKPFVSELADLVAGAPRSVATQTKMFGDEVVTVSHAVEKADVQADIRSRLGHDKRLFGMAATNAIDLERGGNVIQQEASKNISQQAAQALFKFDKAKNYVGPVRDIIDDAARRIGTGEDAAKVKAEAYEKVVQNLSTTLPGNAGEGVPRGNRVPGPTGVQPEAAAGTAEAGTPKPEPTALTPTEDFIRAATKQEKGSATAKSRGYNTIPDREGYEKAYKPYGDQGAGYYYKKLEAVAPEPIPASVTMSPVGGKSKHWIVDVKDANGNSIAVREFSNLNDADNYRSFMEPQANAFKREIPTSQQPIPVEQAATTEPTTPKVSPTLDEQRRSTNGPILDAVQEAIRQGRRIHVTTQYRSTLLNSPDHIKMSSDGTVRIPEGKQWVALTHPQVDELARQAGHPELAAFGRAEPVTPVKSVPPAVAPQATAQAKQPWEMTLDEINRTGYIGYDTATQQYTVHPSSGGSEAANASEHKRQVAIALSQGKPVPDAVLAEYPDLAAKAKQSGGMRFEERQGQPPPTDETLPKGVQWALSKAKPNEYTNLNTFEGQVSHQMWNSIKNELFPKTSAGAKHSSSQAVDTTIRTVDYGGNNPLGYVIERPQGYVNVRYTNDGVLKVSFEPKGASLAAKAKSEAPVAPEKAVQATTTEATSPATIIAPSTTNTAPKGTRYNPNLTSEAQTRADGTIEVGPKFFDLAEGAQQKALGHERAHVAGLDSAAIDDPEFWRLLQQEDMFGPINPVNGEIQHGINGQFKPGENVVEGYAVLMGEPAWLKQHYPKAYDYIGELAQRHNLPVPEEWLRDHLAGAKPPSPATEAASAAPTPAEVAPPTTAQPAPPTVPPTVPPVPAAPTLVQPPTPRTAPGALLPGHNLPPPPTPSVPGAAAISPAPRPPSPPSPPTPPPVSGTYKEGRGPAAQMQELLFPTRGLEAGVIPAEPPRGVAPTSPTPGGPAVQRPLPLNTGAELPATLSKQQQTAADKVLRYRGLPDAAKLPLLQELGLTEAQARAALKLPERGSLPLGAAIEIGSSAIGAGSQYDPNASPQENAAKMAIGGFVGFGLARGLRTGQMGLSVRATGNPQRDSLLQMYERGYRTRATSAREKLDAVVTGFTRGMTDRKVDLARYQARGEQALGRPLTPAENLYYLKRENVDAAAGQILGETLSPALIRVGDDLPYLSEFITYVHDIDIANNLGNPARLFSGGRTLASTQANLTHLQAQLGPARMTRIVQSAQDINDLVNSERELMVRTGVWDRSLATMLEQQYPNYIPTRILDYTLDPAHRGTGTGLSMTNQGLRRLTEAGTLREREDPVNSVIRMVYEMEARAKQNEAFNAFVKIRDADPTLQAEIIHSAVQAPTSDQVAIEGFVNGVRERYLAPKNLRLVTESEGVVSIPLFSGLMHLSRQLLTGRNPVFLASNAIVDAGTYAVRATMREAGARGTVSKLAAPVYLPKVLKEMVGAYADTFQGLTKGRFTGQTTSRYLRGGGGMSGGYSGSPLQMAQQTKEQLARPHVYTVKGPGDILRIARDIATLKPIAAISERIELAPHVAQTNLAMERGATVQKAVMQGRDVTIDFAQGGNWTKMLNEFLMFFNVGVQAVAQPVRAFKEHPVAFTSTVAGLLGGPLVASEVWNNSDEQRARDYADVPQSIKDRGLIFMLPGEAPIDDRGNRHPQLLLLPMRDWAPFVITGRDAINRAMGKEAREWKELAFEAGFSVSPIQGSSPEEVASSFMPSVTGTAMQLAQNKDYFRGRMIATDRSDEQTSTASKLIAEALGVRPSQVEFAARDIGGGTAGTAISAIDRLAGQPEKATGAQGVPILGGLAGRFVKGNIGGELDKAQQELLQPWAKQALREDGVSLNMQPVGWAIQQVPLMMEEQTQYQILTNQYLDDALLKTMMLPRWARLDPDQRKELAQSAAAAAREKAAAEVLKYIGRAEIRNRLLQEYGTTTPRRESLTSTEKRRVLAP
ncbi:MAG: LPD38 domain-containing protein [Dehalococcoidia bacterium]|nr:LPD38 domain-containing protein [Dehalococcoidia bacterium]